jgi:hypothetical protein
LPLVRKTLADLGTPSPSEGRLAYVQAVLAFRRTSYNSNVYRGEFEDVTAERAAAFLNQHIANYIDSELDKSLTVLRMDADFDRKQADAARQRVDVARERLVAFSDKHPEAVPKDSQRPDPVPARPAGIGGGREDLEQSIARDERALSAAFTRIQTQKAGPYREQATAIEAKISDARSRGLKDQHPELKSLLGLQADVRSKIAATMAAEPTAAERAIDPEVVRIEAELTELRRRQASGGAAATPRARALPASAGTASVPRSLSTLRIEYGELAGEYESAKTEHQKLLEKTDKTDRQLERERTSARTRYDVITPPTPSKKAPALVIAKRAGLGAAAGILLALVISAYREMRRVLISRGHIQS